MSWHCCWLRTQAWSFNLHPVSSSPKAYTAKSKNDQERTRSFPCWTLLFWKEILTNVLSKSKDTFLSVCCYSKAQDFWLSWACKASPCFDTRCHTQIHRTQKIWGSQFISFGLPAQVHPLAMPSLPLQHCHPVSLLWQNIHATYIHNRLCSSSGVSE